MIKEWVPSQIEVLKKYQPKEWLPFFGSNEQALKELVSRSLKLSDTQVIYAWYKIKRLLAIYDCEIENETMNVTNILRISSKFNWTECFLMLEHGAKLRRMSKIVISLDSSDLFDDTPLIEYGFVKQDEKYVYDLVYHTGITLGGGGAKGAYQIGVWRALREIGIEYEKVSGTSVGALNGAFFVQGDIENAQKMWETIETNKILSVSLDDSSDDARHHLMRGVKSLTTTALKDNGADTTPLYNMINKMIDHDRMLESTKEFYIVTTLASKMEETVISLADIDSTELPKWLLASASFYPAMSASEINGQYYIDGGFRNNISKDVLLKQGVSELIVIDVKGPGFIKPVIVPRNVVETVIATRWGLGAVLLFDKNRSQWNMVQGYFDGLKEFRRLEGTWYTFPKENYKKNSVALMKQFLTFLNKEEITKLIGRHITPSWVQKKHVVPEFFAVNLLENASKTLNVDPSHIYTIKELSKALLGTVKNNDVLNKDAMLPSVSELLKYDVRKKSHFSDKNLLLSAYHLCEKRSDNIAKFFDVSWEIMLQALFILFLEERED